MTPVNSSPRFISRSTLGTILVIVLALIAAGLVIFLVKKNRESPSSCTQKSTVTYLGDSYTNGTDMDTGPTKRFPYLVSKALNVQYKVLGYNGAGYAVAGPKPFNTTFPEAATKVPVNSSVVVVFGSRNDRMPYAVVYKAALSTYQKLRATVPNAAIIVIGPPWINNKPNDQILSDRNAVRAAAKEAGLQFVDPLALGWFANPSEISDGKNFRIGADHIHPTDAGHAYLASKILPFVKKDLCRG